MRLISTIPALPVRNTEESASFFRDQLGFTVHFAEEDFAIVVRDDVEIHLWGATDETWRTRPDRPSRPVCSGAESFIAGTASCRIEVEEIETLYAEIQPRGILHPRAHLSTTHYGTCEFGVLDPDNNLVTFFERR